ncbi:MAG: RNA polymerase sigma factor [Cytophagaceae bacterium]
MIIDRQKNKKTDLVEHELLDACKRQDRRAMEELYKRYLPKMKAVCYRYTNSLVEVEDILQEAFIKVFTKIDTFQFKGSLEGWIRKIVVNTAINHYHQYLSFPSNLSIDDVNEGEDLSVQIAETLSLEELYIIINQLPDGYRFVFNLVGIEGYSHKEVAEKLGITEATSRSQFTRARQQLISLLNKRI